MKAIRLRLSAFLFLLMFLKSALAQDNSVSKVLSNMKEFDYKVQSIIDLDVYDYFELHELYDTDLKRKMFEQTSDFQEKFNQLKQYKSDLSSICYYVEKDEVLSDYKIDKNGFEIFIRSNTSFNVQIQGLPLPPKTIYSSGGNIFLSSLPVKESNVPTEEKLFISLDNNTGLEVENNKANVRVIFAFKIVGKVSLTYKCFVNNRVLIQKDNPLKVDSVRVLLVNRELDKIYFDKLYVNRPVQKAKK